MDETFTTFTTTAADYSGANPSDYPDDYDEGLTVNTGMCNRSWVRAFRGQYEPPLYWIIFVLGAMGNLLVVGIYAAARTRLKMTTDVYLLNLAVADLLFLGTLPLWAVDVTKGWGFGVRLCKAVSAIYKVNFFSGMLLLTCISVDRYVAIVQVTKAQNLKKKRLFNSKLACLGVWTVSTLLALPELIFAQVKTDVRGHSACTLVYWDNENNWTKILVLSMQICVGFWFPLLVMFSCYSVIIRTLLQARSFEKHKALRVIFAVVSAFVLSQLPFNGILMAQATQASSAAFAQCDTVIALDVAEQVAKSLAYTHACLNPILYVFVGVRFRQDLLRLVKTCAGGLGSGGLGKVQSAPKRPSGMSDTETTPALSL